MNMIGILSIAEHCVARDLQGARVIGAIVADDTPAHGREGGEVYAEWSVFVAWERDEQCGTHRVQVNTREESGAFSGHYQLSREKAMEDMLERAGLKQEITTAIEHEV